MGCCLWGRTESDTTEAAPLAALTSVAYCGSCTQISRIFLELLTHDISPPGVWQESLGLTFNSILAVNATEQVPAT